MVPVSFIRTDLDNGFVDPIPFETTIGDINRPIFLMLGWGTWREKTQLAAENKVYRLSDDHRRLALAAWRKAFCLP